MKTLVIAEAGVNHNGSLEMARQLVDAAAAAGVDYVKFQVGIPELIASRFAEKAGYQKHTTGAGESQLEMIRKISLTFDQHRQLKEYCDSVGTSYLCTPFDLPSIDFLNTLGRDRKGLSLWKVPSGEITNFPYLRAIGLTGKPVILSTGMATLDEIELAIGVLTRFGTSRDAITLLHCTTEYPAPKDQVNLRAMDTMRERFGMPVGYSDHTEGIEIPVAAVAMGAVVIEKHFTLDRTLPGPDHKASLEPGELTDMVSQIRAVESALGDGTKSPAPAEVPNIPIARKSIVAATAIKRGELFTEENLTAKRPGTGLSPMLWESVVGQRAVRDFEADEMIELV